MVDRKAMQETYDVIKGTAYEKEYIKKLGRP